MKIQNGKLVVKDGKAACECCGELPPDELPPWVPDPDDPIWGGGPSGPVPPSGGTTTCCGFANTICSPVIGTPLQLRHLVTGEITVEYSYTTGPNAGTVFDYTAEWLEVFDDDPSTGCQAVDGSVIELRVPYVSKIGDPNNPSQRRIDIRASIRWDQTRGFFGSNADDPMFFGLSGNSYLIDNIGSHVNSGYTITFDFCRSVLPALPITVAPDRLIWIRQPDQANPIRFFYLPATTPTGVCLNRVIADYTDTYTDTTSGGTTTITVTMRFYAFVSGLTPCLTV